MQNPANDDCSVFTKKVGANFTVPLHAKRSKHETLTQTLKSYVEIGFVIKSGCFALYVLEKK